MGTRLNLTQSEKNVILQDAMQRIQQGHTLVQIAADHGLSSRTLHTYLMALGDEYTEARQAYIDNLVANAMADLADVEVQTSIDDEGKETGDYQLAQFQLARAREVFKSVSWLANSRDARYRKDSGSPSVAVTLNLSSSSLGRASELLTKHQPLTIHAPVQEPEEDG